ncbi:MAG TPA: hypothetical protein IAB66_04175 [Candidatus Caccousia avistercoris]|nr:hypothetical protein [Candidatus Caccousia avistercoris]
MDTFQQEQEKQEPVPPPEQEEGEPIQWDGSEAELVVDDDAASYEELQTGIKLSYTLRKEEVFAALEKSGFSKTMGRRALVQCIVLALLAVWFFFYYSQAGGTLNLFFGVVALAALAAAALVPYFGRKHRARQICENPRLANIDMEIYADAVQIGSGDGEWEIPLDGSCLRVEYKNMILLFPAKKKHMVILPLRCVEPGVLPEVQAMLVSGTHRESD